MSDKVKVGILGCTGMVGQRFVQLLESHPQFQVAAVGASERSSGSLYKDACNWKLDTSIPASIATLEVQNCEPKNFQGCQLIFSGLDSSVATEIEASFRDAEFIVFSNAKNYRMHADVPLVVPLVNPDHLEIVKAQRANLGLRRGYIATNANCSTTGLVVPLKPLHDKYQIVQLQVTTMQALSGAGYPGVSSIDILGNVVPFIDGEEEKLETEPLKILGNLAAGSKSFNNAVFTVDAHCNRVPVLDGHMESVSVKFKNPPKSVEEVIETLEHFKATCQSMGLHSAPKQAIVVHRNRDRPQPRMDIMAGNGYSVSVGRVRKGNYWDIKFTLLSHNTILGAAGSSILNAEIAFAKGLLK
eukprot:Partr_v1_DN28602_c3_g2_i2_m49705 putative aspartate-semialdehyde dehydrogenase